MEEATSQPESISEQELTAEKIPRLFPIRLGFFSFMFLAFFAISVLILNFTKIFNIVLGETDIYTQVLNLLRTPITNVPIIRDIYDFIVTFPDEVSFHDFIGKEALYISAGYVLTFLTVSLVAMKQRVARALFTGRKRKRIPLQILLFFTLFILYLQLLKMYVYSFGSSIGLGGLAIYMLICGAGLWIFFQFIALFTAARRSGTRAEGNLTRRSGKASYAFALAAPYFVVGVIIALYMGYTFFIDIVKNYLPSFDASTWQKMTDYFMVGFVAICIVSSAISVLGRKRRQKVYDNMVLIMTNFSMYPYILFNFTMYFLFPQLNTGGSGGDPTFFGQILLWVDLIFTFVLLIMALRSVGKRTGYKFSKLNKHAFIMFLYAALAGQFGIRYLQTRGLPQEIVESLNIFLNGQYLIINFFVIIAAFISVLIFSSKKFGVYFRVHETVSKEDKQRFLFIHDYLKDEFVRRQEPYLLDSIYDALATVMKVDKFVVMQLVEKTKRNHPDLLIDGLKKRYVYFETA
nr:hypothetical protein [Candidatus Sigynarchaeota archaeon]